MKSMKRVLTLVLAFALVFSLCGCGGTKTVKVVNSVSGACGSMTVTGNLGNSGKVRVNGTFPSLRGYQKVYNNTVFDYTRSGNRVTLKKGPLVISGNYNSATGKFTMDYQSSWCSLW